MYFSIVTIIPVDSEGRTDPEFIDSLGVRTLVGKSSLDEVIDVSQFDSILSDLSKGTNVKFEVFVVKYVSEIDKSTPDLIQYIDEHMIALLDSGDLEYVDDYEFYATVNHNELHGIVEDHIIN